MKNTKKELPKETSRGKIKIGEVEIEVITLSDGTRLITQESINDLFFNMGFKETEILENKLDTLCSNGK